MGFYCINDTMKWCEMVIHGNWRFGRGQFLGVDHSEIWMDPGIILKQLDLCSRWVIPSCPRQVRLPLEFMAQGPPKNWSEIGAAGTKTETCAAAWVEFWTEKQMQRGLLVQSTTEKLVFDHQKPNKMEIYVRFDTLTSKSWHPHLTHLCEKNAHEALCERQEPLPWCRGYLKFFSIKW